LVVEIATIVGNLKTTSILLYLHCLTDNKLTILRQKVHLIGGQNSNYSRKSKISIFAYNFLTLAGQSVHFLCSLDVSQLAQSIANNVFLFFFVFTCIYFANDLDSLIHHNKIFTFTMCLQCSVVNPCWRRYILRILCTNYLRVYPHVT
jgi:hypothetical protein